MKKMIQGLLFVLGVMYGAFTFVSVSAQTSYPMDVQHASGITTLEKEPEKIVVLDYGAFDTLDSIGAGDKVVGMIQGTLPENLTQYSKLPVVGSAKEPDVEAIARLEPDLVIVGNRQSSNYDAISELWPTIDASVSWNELSPEDTYTNRVTNSIQMIGEAVNHSEEGQTQIDAINGKVESYQNLGEGKAMALMSSGGEISMHSPQSRFAPIFEVFAFEDMALSEEADEGHKGDKISFETVQSLNPDWLFVLDRDQATSNDENAQPASAVLDNDLVKSTTAYQENQIIYLNPTEWYLIMNGANNYQLILDEVADAIQNN